MVEKLGSVVGAVAEPLVGDKIKNKTAEIIDTKFTDPRLITNIEEMLLNSFGSEPYSDNSKDVTYHYLGFLCIDSMQKFREDQAEFTKLYNVLILLGGALYPLLENYLVNEIEKV